MTEHKHLKTLVRSRMARTGESYSAARRHVARGANLTPQAVIDAHDGHCMVVRFTPDGRSVLSGGFGGQARLWSGPQWAPAGELRGHTSSVNGIAIDPSGRRAVTISSDGSARVWDLPNRTEERLLGRHTGAVTGVDVSSGGEVAATVGQDGRLRWWRLVDGAPIGDVSVGERPASVALHPSRGLSGPGNDWAAVTTGARVRVLTVAGEAVAELESPGPASTAVRWSTNGDVLATSSVDGAVRMWETDGWDVVREIGVPGGGWVPLAVSPDGRFLAVGWDHHVGVWTASGADPSTVVGDLPKGVYSLDFSPDGSRLALGSADGRVRIWGIG
jgi:WD40 repeat protein